MSDLDTVAGLAAAYRARAVSPVEVTRTRLAAIERLDPDLHAFLLLTPERALAQAQAAETRMMAGLRLGPLDGVPIAHKDNLDTAGIETTGNSTRYRGRVPVRDAGIVANLAHAGAVMLGKLGCYEGAFAGPDPALAWPVPCNPWGLDRSTAGSSSGSAVALAARLVAGASGSDTGGSLRDPAGLCGVVGLKPRFGSLPVAGMFPFAPSLDTPGPMATTARDAALLLAGMRGEAGVAAYLDQPLRGLRIGVTPSWCDEAGVSDDVDAVLTDTIAGAADAGAMIVPVEPPPLAAFGACGWTIALAELLASHAATLAADGGAGLGPMLRRGLAVAETIPAHRYIAALEERGRLTRAMRATCADVDVLLLPAQDAVASLVADVVGALPFEKATLTLPFCVTGDAAIVIPAGSGANDLPIGVQLAACGDERVMLRAACALERVLNVRRRPPIVA